MKQNHHFFLTCFPIQGHINPCFQLAKNLAHAGATVTFATTIRCFDQVKNRLPTLNGLSYRPFSDGHDQDQHQYDEGIICYMADLRRVGSESIANLLRELEDEGKPVTCLVYSILLPWTAAVARDMHVPSAFLAIQCTTSFAIYHRFFNSHDGIHDECVDSSSSVTIKIQDLPLFYPNELPTFLLRDDRLKMNSLMCPLMLEHMQELEKDRDAFVFLNTFHELEQEAMKEFKNKLNVIPIGPLLPSAFFDGVNPTDTSYGMDLFNNTEDDYVQWLDSKSEQSVVYVAFGSLASMNKDQKIEILNGLVQSRRPFLWVISSSNDDDQGEEIKKMLDNEALKDGDWAVVPWCSQMQVLKHKSIGCFVTHCGWNSTLESLACGVPLVACPQFSDQTTNAKLVEEVWGNGVRARANDERKIERGELKRCMDIVMGDCERGKQIRENATKWRCKAVEAVKEGGSTYKNFNKVLGDQVMD